MSARLRQPETITLIVATLGFCIVVVDTTAVNVALHDIDADFDASISGLQWIVDAYTVVFAALLLSAGAFSDRVGAMRAYVIGMSLFVLASVGCGMAPNLETLIGARILQGASAAVMLPSSLAIVSSAFSDPDEQRKAISLWTMGGAVAITAGPILGGVLTDLASWRWVFFVNIPLGGLALIGSRYVKRSEPRPSPVDWPGQLLAIVTLGALTFGVIEGGHEGFDTWFVVLALVVAFGALATFVGVQLRVPTPLLPLKLFAAPTAWAGLLIALLIFGFFYGMVFTLSLFFQDVLEHSPTEAGLMFLPMTVLMTGSTMLVGPMVKRFGTWVPLALGLELLAAGFLGLMAVDADSSLLLISAALVPMGFGMALAGPPIPMALMAALPPERAGLVSGVFSATRQTGATLGVAICGALVSAGDQFSDGMHIALGLGVGALAICVALTVMLIRPRVEPAAVTA